MKLLLFMTLVFSMSGWAQGLPTGTYKGSRLCSDGSIPADTQGKYPIFINLRADGTYTTLGDHQKTNGHVCSLIMNGTYRFAGGILYSTSQTSEQCGDCGDSGGSHPSSSETKADVQLTAKGFIFRSFTDYQEGGSCKPGQHMIVKFEKMTDLDEDLKQICQSIEAS